MCELTVPSWRPHNVTAEQQQQDSHTGGATEEVRTLLNMNELTKWGQANATLFSVLFLITTGPAGSLMSEIVSKLDKRANGQEDLASITRQV